MNNLLVNIGGTKGWLQLPEEVRKAWTCMDRSGCQGSFIIHKLNEGGPFPLEDTSVQAYYSSHTLEHVRPENLRWVLAEMHRTLVPEGRVRIVVPDIRKAIKAYLASNMEALSRGPSAPDFYPPTQLGKLMAWWVTPDGKGGKSGHHMVFDYETLAWYLMAEGFHLVVRRAYKECSPIFQGLDFPRYQDFSIYVEAVK